MIKRFRIFICLLMLLALWGGAVLAAASSQGEESVRIGVLSFRPKPQTLAQWQPLATALKHAIPEWEFEIEALTYPEMNQAVAERCLDFVFTNPGHFVLLKMRGGLSAPLATLSVDLNGRRFSVFGGVIFSRLENTKINALRDIKGKRIAVPDKESLGGYQMQAFELRRQGVRLPQDAQLLVTGMPHDNVVQAVLDGRAEVGFVRSGVLESAAREGKVDLKRLKVLNLQHLPDFPQQVSTRLYPEWPFSALANTDEKRARHVAAALFTLEENNPVLRAGHIRSFSVPADYTPVEEVLRELRFPPFDVAPPFTLSDVWERYRWQILGAFLALMVIMLLGFRLMLTKRRLEAEKKTGLAQAKQIRESESRLRTILDNEPECIKTINAGGLLSYINPAGLSMLEADSPEQVVGRPMLDFINPEYRSAYRDLHDRVLAGEKMQMEFEVHCLKGGRRRMETHAVPIDDRGAIVHLAVTRDITERKRMEQQLEHLAHYDALTSLPNRVLFSDRLQQALALVKRNGNHLAVMFIDLDRFKPINDTYGHGVGDLLLQEVAKRIKGSVRESDTVARIGGDEFIALLQNIKEGRDAKAVAEKIRYALNEPFDIAGQSLGISSSIGIAVFPEHGRDEIELCRNADSAMYKAKGMGKGAVALFPGVITPGIKASAA